MSNVTELWCHRTIQGTTRTFYYNGCSDPSRRIGMHTMTPALALDLCKHIFTNHFDDVVHDVSLALGRRSILVNIVDIRRAPVEVRFIVTGWADKVAWVRTNIVVAAVACRLAAANVLVSIDKVVSVCVEVVQEDQLCVHAGQERRPVVYVYKALEDLKPGVHVLQRLLVNRNIFVVFGEHADYDLVKSRQLVHPGYLRWLW